MKPQLDLICLVVADMATSLAFYRTLGLDIPPEADTERHVEVTLPGGVRLAWEPVDFVKEMDPEWTAPVGSAQVSLAFLCDSPAEVDAAYAHMAAAGYTGNEPWDAFWGQRYATLSDPDGNGIDLFSPLA
jgi:catechol 2,3-dioxygenase-like lactoylglutathione lyase family enzyme